MIENIKDFTEFLKSIGIRVQEKEIDGVTEKYVSIDDIRAYKRRMDEEYKNDRKRNIY